MRNWLGAVAALTMLPLVAGCASSPHRTTVSTAAVSFVQALAEGDGSAACDLLAPDAQKSASGATGTACEDAIISIEDDDTTIGGVQVWGDAAQVHVGTDVLFLRRLSGKWLVSAAGCEPQAEGPYDCKVGG
jgi:hypothetical protein